jgi:hypothetical protein
LATGCDVNWNVMDGNGGAEVDEQEEEERRFEV